MYIDSPNISGSLNITGSLLLNGTAVTASGGGGGSGAGFPFSGSAVITGSLYVSGGNLSGSFAGDGSGLTNITSTIDEFATVNDTFTNVPSHSVVHNFGTKDVFVQVFESDDTLLIPQTVTTTNTNQVDIVFGDVLSGRVVIGKAGHILQNTGNFVSSSTVVQTFTNATTASINHYLDSLNVITQVFDSNNNVIVPSNIKVATKDRVNLTFASSRSGKVVIAKAGHIVSGTAASASFATTAERVRAGSSGSRDESTPETGSLWFNTNTATLEVYNGASGSGWSTVGDTEAVSGTATGGSVTTSGSYTYHSFTTSGDFTVSDSNIQIETLIIGGGGGSGYSDGTANCGGGGGAGGLLFVTSTEITPGTYTVTIGGGGGINTSGQDSVFNSNTAIGGGAGGAASNASGANGGSGGGAGPGTANVGSGTVGQGNDGGPGDSRTGGSGGGAGAAGTSPSGTGVATDGGAGINTYSLWATATSTGDSGYYSGGGAPGTPVGSTAALGGIGGGGDGGEQVVNRNGQAGSPNTGGGGGSGSDGGGVSAAGGSGLVIIRYLT